MEFTMQQMIEDALEESRRLHELGLYEDALDYEELAAVLTKRIEESTT